MIDLFTSVLSDFLHQDFILDLFIGISAVSVVQLARYFMDGGIE